MPNTKIKDEDFKSPIVLNKMNCVSASRFLNKVDEYLKIVRVCQDPMNPGFVAIDFQLAGVYDFIPTCTILTVDNKPLNQTAPLLVENYRNPVLPIKTACKVFNGTLVYDFARIIQNHISAREIAFELKMEGTLSKSLGLGFDLTKTVTDQYLWKKGVFPSPIGMFFDNGQLVITFEFKDKLDCSCNILCTVPSGVQYDVQYCPDTRQKVIINTGPLTGDPSQISLKFRDVVGNLSELAILPMINVKPKPPKLSHKLNPTRIEIGIDKSTVSGMPLQDVEYQLWRYEGTESNIKLISDWTHRDWQVYVDTDLLPGTVYGYSIRFKGKFNDVSKLSEWVTQVG